MDARFKEFLIKDFEKMPSDPKHNFLRMLKNNPQAVTQVIRNNLMDWGMNATLETGRAILIDLDDDSVELTKHLQEHFEKDLQAVSG